jgi:transcriptional regulator with XRE-family HTH domain
VRRSIHSKPYVALREALTRARAAAKLTQEQVAAQLARPQSYVAKYETGDRRLDAVELIEVCEVLDIEADLLLNDIRQALAQERKTGRRV